MTDFFTFLTVITSPFAIAGAAVFGSQLVVGSVEIGYLVAFVLCLALQILIMMREVR